MRRLSPARLAALLLPLAAPAAAPAAETGSLRVLVEVRDARGGRERAPSAVVWLPGSVAPERRPKQPPRLAQHDKRFEPRVLAVPAGTTVEFPNYDRIFHNVFSLSSNATFDLGLYRNGDYRPYTFKTPGLVKVYCNIHPQMAAFVMVVDGDLVALTGPDGVARLEGVPPGRHEVRVWDERGGEKSETVEVAAGAPASLDVLLDGSRYRESPHKNKHGKDYPPPDDDENRY